MEENNGNVCSLCGQPVLHRQTVTFSQDANYILKSSGNNKDAGDWTKADGEGLDYPTPHVHVWKRGILPGGKYIKSCVCGATEDVEFEIWQTISDR